MAREIESAAGIRIGLCPDCNQIHLYLIDDDGEDFADAVLGGEIGPQLLVDLQMALAMRQSVN